jgi:hypothetical protein
MIRTEAHFAGRQTMIAAQFEQLDEVEAEEILRWRFQRLTSAGYQPRHAMMLASRIEIDLHEATDLVDHGCPSETALRILL